ncbi:MAG: hypothetical protein L0099_04070 [Acidobacteria bacterium]|nr:hypothetical protein [Acidobacteriota bacterium]
MNETMREKIAGVGVAAGFGLLLANLAMAADMATVDIRVVNDIGEPVSAALVYTSTPVRLGPHLMLPTWRHELNYFFRVRSATQRPVFGKIHGPIRCTTDRGAPQLKMLYYVNPDGSRNIEFAKSLFFLRDLKRIGAPRSALPEVWWK